MGDRDKPHCILKLTGFYATNFKQLWTLAKINGKVVLIFEQIYRFRYFSPI
jgi:hypothetical protein